VEPGIALESSDQKTRVFRVLIALKWLLLEHAYKVFGEIHVRT
jgi:hypothetical protein